MHDSASLGLARGLVAVRAYDPRWGEEYEREELRLRSLLGQLAAAIEHIGSTAVPGLSAKPVLDVAVACADLPSLTAARGRLATAGYEDRGDLGEEGGVIVVKGPASCRTHCLHLVGADSAQWRRYLGFRDDLRRDPRLREGYAALKTELAERFPQERRAYVAGKDPFIKDALTRIAVPARD